jgi:hypothetical protein
MTTTNKTAVSGIDSIYQVTADVTLSGMDLLVLMSCVKNGADANVAALKLAQPADDGVRVLDKAITAIADSADELLERLHAGYIAALDALWAAREQHPGWRHAVRPTPTAPKVER